MKSGDEILIGGNFTTVGGVTHKRVARFSADVRDDTFNPDISNGAVNAIAKSGSQILIGGTFTTIGGSTRNRVARLTSSGTLDSTFQTDVGGLVNVSVTCIALQTDPTDPTKVLILIGGEFTTVNGASRNRVVRLLPSDGSLDNDFRQAPGTDLSTHGPNAVVRAIAIDTQGMIEIGGDFTTYRYDLNGQTINATRQRVARIGGL